MKIDIQKSKERGYAKYSWLETFHSFSFANYMNPKRMSFGLLRVLNEDYIKPSAGFPEHDHDNMEIVTIVLDGELEHKDSSGGSGIMRRGEVQRMSAGLGVVHSEFNPSHTNLTHLLQIWIDTNKLDIDSSYEQASYKLKRNSLTEIVGENGTVKINQDARFLLGELDAATTVKHEIKNPENGIYLFVINGSVEIDGNILDKGDAAGITHVHEMEIRSLKNSHILLIEVPMN